MKKLIPMIMNFKFNLNMFEPFLHLKYSYWKFVKIYLRGILPYHEN